MCECVCCVYVLWPLKPSIPHTHYIVKPKALKHSPHTLLFAWLYTLWQEYRKVHIVSIHSVCVCVSVSSSIRQCYVCIQPECNCCKERNGNCNNLFSKHLSVKWERRERIGVEGAGGWKAGLVFENNNNLTIKRKKRRSYTFK